jgi:hypothetical protein
VGAWGEWWWSGGGVVVEWEQYRVRLAQVAGGDLGSAQGVLELGVVFAGTVDFCHRLVGRHCSCRACTMAVRSHAGGQ